MILDFNRTSLYGQFDPSPGILFGWTETSLQSTAPPPPILIPRQGGGWLPKKRRKEITPGNWPAMIRPSIKQQAIAESPQIAQIEPIPETTIPKPIGYIAPSKTIVNALARRNALVTITDPAVLARISAWKQKMALDREEEETLWMMGAFD
jgi:hypothetical protein